VCGEVPLPQSRSKLSDAGCRVLADALQDVDEVGVHVDAMQPAGDDERLDDANMLGAELRPAEVPIFTPHRYDSQGALKVVRVQRDIGVGQEHLEPSSAFASVIECIDERVLWAQSVRLEPPIHPAEERLHVRLAVYQAMQSLGLPCELLAADLLLNVVERADAAQSFTHALGIGRFGLEDLPACVRPALSVSNANLLGVARIGNVPVG